MTNLLSQNSKCQIDNSIDIRKKILLKMRIILSKEFVFEYPGRECYLYGSLISISWLFYPTINDPIKNLTDAVFANWKIKKSRPDHINLLTLLNWIML